MNKTILLVLLSLGCHQVGSSAQEETEYRSMVAAHSWLITNCPLASSSDGMQSDVLSCSDIREGMMFCSSDSIGGTRRVLLHCTTDSSPFCQGTVLTRCR